VVRKLEVILEEFADRVGFFLSEKGLVRGYPEDLVRVPV
jgi:hypothetical protein